MNIVLPDYVFYNVMFRHHDLDCVTLCGANSEWRYGSGAGRITTALQILPKCI